MPTEMVVFARSPFRPVLPRHSLSEMLMRKSQPARRALLAWVERLLLTPMMALAAYGAELALKRTLSRKPLDAGQPPTRSGPEHGTR